MSCDGSIAFSAKITSVGQKTFIILMKKASPRNGPVGEAFLLSFRSEIHCSELLHIQILINQDAVDCFQVECNFAFRFQLDGEEIFRTFEHLFVSEIDESRIERLLTVGMQAVVCQVFHRTEVCRFDADKVIILLVVRQCETQSVDSFDTVTFDGDFDCFAGVVRLFRSGKEDRSGYTVRTWILDAVLQLGCHDRYVVSIDQTVPVNITCADIIEIAVTTA